MSSIESHIITMSSSSNEKSQPATRVWVRRSLMTEARPSSQSAAGGFARRSRSFDAEEAHVSTTTTPKSFRRTLSGDGLPSPSLTPSRRGGKKQHVLHAATTQATPEWKSAPYEWAQAWIVDQTADTVSVRLDSSEFPSDNNHDNNKTVTLPRDKLETDIWTANTATGSAVTDLCTLEQFHEPAVVECLAQRYAAGHVYTSTGPVLIAVNPFQALPAVYSTTVMEDYWMQSEEPQRIIAQQQQQQSGEKRHLGPHVYATADHAFRNMMRAIEMTAGTILQVHNNNSDNNNIRGVKYNQSILVSGESGAGKTVTTRHIMQYLAALSQRTAQAAQVAGRAYLQVKKSSSSSSSNHPAPPTEQNPSVINISPPPSSSIETQVLQSNPILEAFGNARTVRNDNSSRFGKFIQLQFTPTGRLTGCGLDTYLLEKVRVVTQSAGERNYHIFYQLLADGALTAEEASRLHLGQSSANRNHKNNNDDSSGSGATTTLLQPHDFLLTNGSGTYTRRDGVPDRETFAELKKAMRLMGFAEPERADVWNTTAALLHASNLTFLERSDDDDTCELDTTNKHLAAVCDLLGVSSTALVEALCFRTISARDSTIRSPLTLTKAQKGLHALLKATYGALFAYLVQRINASIRSSVSIDDETATIGVLDIFGFESFAVNSFEQLCINYCNEVLQQQFNTFMLKNEQAEYANEGIDWDFVSFPENQDVLDLLDDRKDGIMPILDDMCRAPGATDKVFVSELVKRCERKKRFKASSKPNAPFFSIDHYAGTVEYNTDYFVEKNRDGLPREASILLLGSSKPFVHKLAEIIQDGNEGPSVESSCSGGPKKGGARPTVGGQFLQQVKTLRKKIDSTSPHYVRCIKPNALLAPGHFDSTMVANQLRCGGVMQAVSVTKDGFTLHYAHDDFLSRYSGLVRLEGHCSRNGNGAANPTKKEIENNCRVMVDVLLTKIATFEKDDSLQPTASGSPKRDPDNTEDALIQIGKSKVLLKHHAFESLESMLGALQNEKATILNAIFRRHLCRVAFQAVRDCFRGELRQLGQTFDDWFKENREIYYQPRKSNKSSAGKGHVEIPNIVKMRMAMLKKSTTTSRNSKNKTVNLQNSAWILRDGLWARNPDYRAS